jgi:glycosyltransferase involved in cell wall biosynthesis
VFGLKLFQKSGRRRLKPALMQVADFSADYGGNFIASLLSLAGPCENEGLRLVLVFPEQARQRKWCADLIDAGHAVRFVPAVASYQGDAQAIRRIARQENAEIVHTHFTRFDLPGWYALRNSWTGHRARVVWHAHSSLLRAAQTAKRRAENLIKYGLIGRAVQMIAVSEAVRQELIAASFPSNRVGTITNGIAFERAIAAKRCKEQVFRELRIEAGSIFIMMIGWDPLRKGVDVALQAIRKIHSQGHPVVMGIVGTEQLRKYLAGAGASESELPWLRVLSPTEDIAALYQAATLFLTPSRSEGFTYAACEAFANGLPVVLADIPPVAWARDFPAALFCKVGDGDSLAACIAEALTWPADVRANRLAESKELVRQKYDIGVWARKVVDFYRYGPPMEPS